MADETGHKPALQEVSSSLREVHRALVKTVSAAYEALHGPSGGPSGLLRLLTEDPFFAWLHPMSELIVDLDSLLAQELLPSGTVAAVRLEVDRLTSAGGAAFWEKYAPQLQTEPGVAIAHGRLKQALKALPLAAPGEGLHDRKGWVTPRVHTRRGNRN